MNGMILVTTLSAMNSQLTNCRSDDRKDDGSSDTVCHIDSNGNVIRSVWKQAGKRRFHFNVAAADYSTYVAVCRLRVI